MSEDSLINIEDDSSKINLPSTTIIPTSPHKCPRSLNLDEHMKSVKQKKEEVDVLRLQKFQEQLRKKEQKW